MKGSTNYKKGQNLEPIANAITSMGQSASKKDKPEVLGEKIKKISTDATAVEGNVLSGQTFYAGGIKKTGNMANRGAWTGRIGVNGKIAIPAGYHNGSGYVDQAITNRGAWSSNLGINGSIIVPEGYHNGQGKITQSIATKGSQTYVPKTSNQVIKAGHYLSGAQTISGDPNLIPSNIVKGKTIFGVSGTFISTPPLFIIKKGVWQNSFGGLLKLPGWKIPLSSVSTIGDKMRFLVKADYNSETSGANALSKLIDLSYYNKMVIKFPSSASNATMVELFLVPSDKLSMVKRNGSNGSLINNGSTYAPVYTSFSGSYYGGKVLELNVSSLTGNYYFVVFVQLDAYSYDSYLDINNMYLSVDPII